MPKASKGSRIAASRARAQAAARKKSHATGPDLTGALKPTPTDNEVPDEQAADIAIATAAAQPAPQRAVAVASPRRRTATRRERQALTVTSAGNLKWELSLIAITTAAAGVVLAVLKLATDLGR